MSEEWNRTLVRQRDEYKAEAERLRAIVQEGADCLALHPGDPSKWCPQCTRIAALSDSHKGEGT